MQNKIYILVLLLFLGWQALGQEEQLRRVFIDGKVYPVLISGGDTMIIADLGEVTIRSKRIFASRDDEALYNKYRRYAIKVYPYAIEAIKVFREMEKNTEDMRRRDRKKYIKKLQDDLEREFEEPLKNLSKTQGMILVKMIEREQKRPMYDLVSELRGTFTAMYWSTFSYFYGYRLRRGYVEGDNRILDMVLKDFNISYDIDNPQYTLPEHYKASGQVTK
ncbi:MAG: DUF4294 domain-containing protein [Saprospiraceae bacterium]|nr:DUF4294 domain-containing protein [Saprospiraceae bacterium]MCB9313553.1 DUF4294 domain-containing protein [Lewinellaceae bacterium]